MNRKVSICLLAIGLAGLVAYRFHVPALFEIVTLNLRYNLLSQLDEDQDLQLKYLLRYKQLTQETLGETNYLARSAPSMLGDVYLAMGRTDDALKEYRQSLELKRKAFGGDNDLTVAREQARIGNAYFQGHQYENAAERYTAAVNIIEGIGKQGGVSSTAYSDKIMIAFCLANLGRAQEASDLFKRIQAEAPNAPEAKQSNLKQKAEGFQSAATTAMINGKWDEVVTNEQEALKIYRQTVSPRSLAVANAKAAIAGSYLQLNKFADAAREMSEVIGIQTERLGEGNIALAYSHITLGLIDEKQGKTREAVEEYLAALKIQKQQLPEHSVQTGTTHVTVGRVYLAQRDWIAAYEHFNEATKILAADYASFGTGTGGEGQLQLQAYDGLLLAASELPDTGQENRAMLVRDTLRAAQAAARSAAAEAISSTSARLQAGNPNLAEKVLRFDGISRRYQVVAAQFLAGSDAGSAAGATTNLRATLDDLINQKDGLRRQIEKEFPPYFNLVNPVPVELEDIRKLKLLGPDEALVVFRFANNTTYVWAVSQDDATWADLKVPPAEIDKRVNELLGALQNPFSAYKTNTSRFSLDTAFSLYQLLFGRIEQVLGTKTLLIVPSGSLATIPLHVLVTGVPPPEAADAQMYNPAFYQGARWLALRQSLVTLPAVQSLKALRADLAKASEAPLRYIGFGDPVLPVADLPSLPNASVEIEEAAHIFAAPPDAVRLGEDASESAVKSLPLANYRVLHLATHALGAAATLQFGGLNEPSLVLAKGNTDDGFLTASEVAALKLNADWVILSACDTASEGKQGEGTLSGLARAFLYAGARSLLVSHWVVEDAAASRLIAKIVETHSIEKGESIADGLRLAMQSLITDREHGEYAYPAKWAPFVVVGSPAPSAH